MSLEAEICIVLGVCVLCFILVHRDILKRLFSRAIRSISPRSPFQRQHGVPDEFFHDDTYPPQSVGLEYSFISSLPVFQYGKNEGDQKKPINADCVICLGEFEKGEELKLLPSCTHGFHVSCIDAWFQSHSNCPLCRSNVQNAR